MKPVALISPVLSFNSTLNSLPLDFEFDHSYMLDFFIHLTLIVQLLWVKKHEIFIMKHNEYIKLIQVYFFKNGFRLSIEIKLTHFFDS